MSFIPSRREGELRPMRFLMSLRGSPAGAAQAKIVDRGAVRLGNTGRVGRQVDRRDAELRQRLDARRAVRIGHHHLEQRPVGVAGVELAAVVRVEDIKLAISQILLKKTNNVICVPKEYFCF
jgi:hypothetical protein